MLNNQARMKQLSYIISILVIVVVSDGVAELSDRERDWTWEKQCAKYGTDESFDNLRAAKSEVLSCVRGQLNYPRIQNEIEKAMSTGGLDIVFRKYCRRSTKISSCINNLLKATEPCMSPDQHPSILVFVNIVDTLINFICFEEGERIALFIREGGLECVEDEAEGIHIDQCFNNSTFSLFNTMEQDEFRMFKWNEKGCLDIVSLQKCVVGHLEKCSKPTPATIIDGLFKSVLMSTPCHKIEAAGSASMATLNSRF